MISLHEVGLLESEKNIYRSDRHHSFAFAYDSANLWLVAMYGARKVKSSKQGADVTSFAV